MQNLLFDELCLKRAKKNFLTFALVCVAVLSLVYTPIYLLLSSNVLWRNSVLLFLLTELVDPLIDFSFYWGSFAFLIYIYLRFGKKQIKDFLIVYASGVAARYFITLFVGYLLMSFPKWKVFFGEELPSALFSIAMYALQMLGLLLLTELCRRSVTAGKTYTKGREGEELIANCLPVEGLFNLKQPIVKLCFLAAIIPAGLKLLSRLYYDIFFWGLPTEAAEWLLLVTYYIGDIATWLIGYFVLLYLVQAFYTKEVQKRIEFES